MINSKSHLQHRLMHNRGASPFSSTSAAVGLFRSPRLSLSSSPHHINKARDDSHVCRATLDDPEIKELVDKMEANRPTPPVVREKLDKALALIDAINANDPKKIPPGPGADPGPYRLVYSNWLKDWVEKLDPKASDELLILAKGRNVEGWKLSEIKRDDYSPNSGGQRQFEYDRKLWLANRLEGIMKEAGYEGEAIKLVKEVMLNRNIPDPRDIRRYDLTGQLGAINYTLLEEASMIQVLRDADALVFMEKSFPAASCMMGADELMPMLKKEIGRVSNRCLSIILGMKWSEVQLKMITKALPPTTRYRGIMLAAEGTAASSSHPGDWRFKDFSYD